MTVKGLPTAGERTFRPDHRPFFDSTAATLRAEEGAGVKRLTSSFALLGLTGLCSEPASTSVRLATYWLPGSKRLKGQMPVTL